MAIPSEEANPSAHTEYSEKVDVVRAKEEFNELSRQLSSRSETISSLGTQSTQSDAAIHDIEKGSAPNEHFDLREYLTSSNDANQKAGIKHKVCRLFIVGLPLVLNNYAKECRGHLG